MTPGAKEANRIRGRVKRGTASDDEKAWLAGYKPGKRGRPAKGEVRESVADDDSPGPSGTETERPPIAPEFEFKAEAPAPEAPRVGPRTERSGSKKSDWRAKYRAGAAQGEREATCLQLAELWKHGLKKMNASIVAHGGQPVIPDDVIDGPLGNCIVLTVDKFMPADFSVGPEVEAAVASSVVIGQAWWARRQAHRAPPRPTKQEAAYVNPDIANEPSPGPSATVLSLVRTPATPSYTIDENTRF